MPSNLNPPPALLDLQPAYPFTALVGQEKMKQALLLNLVHPGLGGLLIRGQRGTAKSTAVRGLTRLMPPVETVADCPFRCHPRDPALMCDVCLERRDRGEDLPSRSEPCRLVNLPLGTTEDRLLGALDFEAALARGERRFEPGLLARANQAVLYVDEVNLLGDHLVDLLLDAAALGVNYVEREGISFRHPSRFTLIGTMNPEEGDLRPQLLDRFGICVDVSGSAEVGERVEVARRRIAYETDPQAFAVQWAGEEAALGEKIRAARERLRQVEVPPRLWETAARLSLSYGVEGHRSDLTMIKAAQGLCALEGRLEVIPPDLLRAAELSLAHRLKNQELTGPRLDSRTLEQMLEEENAAGADPDTTPLSADLKKKTWAR
jgi:Mg-chelatase subunit ChlI